MKQNIKAKLTTFDATMVVISLVIGIGIFRTPAMVASATQNVWLFFGAWVVGGIISLLGALTFAEIGSRFPEPGAYYKVVADCYHSSLAFMLNWTGILVVNGAGTAAVAMIGAEYLNPILLPEHLQSPLSVQITAAAMIFVLFVLNYLGIKTGAWTQNFLSLLKIVMIMMVFIGAVAYASQHLIPAEMSRGPASPLKAFAIGLISVFYTYGGYQLTINFGADVREAKRNLPRAILFGCLIILLCYLLLNLAYFLVLGINGIAGAKLVAARVMKSCFGQAGFLFISLAIFLSAAGFANVSLMQNPRSYYAMAKDRTLPPVFMKLNPKTQVQEFTLIFFAGVILVSIFLLGTFEKLVNYVMFLDSANIAVVASTLFVLRHRQAKTSNFDGFMVPFYPVLPGIFVLFLAGISVNVLLTQTREALFGGIIFLLGYPLFWILRKNYNLLD